MKDIFQAPKIANKQIAADQAIILDDAERFFKEAKVKNGVFFQQQNQK